MPVKKSKVGFSGRNSAIKEQGVGAGLAVGAVGFGDRP